MAWDFTGGIGSNINEEKKKKSSSWDFTGGLDFSSVTEKPAISDIPGEGSPEIKRLASELFVDAPQSLTPNPPVEQPRSFWQKVGDAISTMQGNDTGATEPPPFQLPAEARGPFSQKHPILAQGLYQAGQPIRDIMSNPWMERTGQAGAETMTMQDNPEKADTGSRFGNVSADLLGGLMGFAGNPASVGAKLWGGTEQAISGALPLIPKLNVLPAIAQTGLKMGATTLPYEATRAIANDRPFDAGEAGTAAASNALLGMLLHGGGKALASFRRPGEVPGESTRTIPEAPPGVNTAPQKPFTSLRLPGTEKAAMDRLNEGIQEAQNFVKHNDVLAAYPPGTTVEAALADIKANTGIDLPKLMNDVEAIQGRPGLRQQAANEAQFSRLGQAAGAIPEPAKLVGPGRERILGGVPPLRVTPPMAQPVRGTLPQGISPMSFTVPEKMAPIGEGQKVRSFQVSAANAPITDSMTKAGLVTDIYPGGPGAYRY